MALLVAGGWVLVDRPLARAGTAAQEAQARPRPPVPTVHGATCTAGAPRRVVYPALGVDAAVERIGLDTEHPPDAQGRRRLGNPSDTSRVGWFADGPRPGDGQGTVLLDGHTYRDGSAVFGEDFATRARAGQVVQTVQADGSVCSYRVERVWAAVSSARDYPRIIGSEHLYDRTGPERLFLATCGGSWNAAARNYDDISVLVAVPVGR